VIKFPIVWGDQVDTSACMVPALACRCLAHGFCQHPSIDIICAGTPCQDWSTRNSRGLCQFGPRGYVLVCFIRSQLLSGTPIWIHENVTSFEVWLLFLLCMHFCTILTRVVSPRDCGFGAMSRTRRYTIIYLNAAVRVVRDPWALFDIVSNVMRNSFMTRVRDICVADFEEVSRELLPLCNKVRVDVHKVLDFARKQVNDVTLLLTVDEKRRLNDYRHLWLQRHNQDSRHSRDAAFNLNQNICRASWSGASSSVPCISTKSEKLWIDFLGRWLTVREILLGMTYPSYEAHANASGVAVFDLGDYCQSQARHLVGNAMTVGVVGSVAACAMASVVPKPQM
jgi:hypothetical protein